MSTYSDFNKYFQTQPLYIKNILEEFKKPINDNVFYINFEILRTDSDLIEFNNSLWNMRPDVFCQDYYNQNEYYPIILLVNNISSIFLFNGENLEGEVIISPYENTILKVLNS